MTRVLIFTATVGEGHDLPARTLADQLREESPDSEIVTEDGLRAMGRGFVLVNEKAAGVVFFRLGLQWLWDATFWLCVGFAPTRRLTQAAVHALGSRGVLRLVRHVRPDVIVSVYPMTTEVLGKLRRTGRLDIPVVAAITDLAAMHYWAAPGIDLHLVIHPESIEEVREVAGADSDVQVVHGLTRPEFARPCDPLVARAALGLPADGKVVLVSGGGWGVGDLESAVDAALALNGTVVACLCGRNEELRERLRRPLPRPGPGSRRRLHGADERMACGRGRTRSLDRWADGARGVRARLPDDLLRLGPRAHPREQRSLPALRDRRGRRLRERSRPARCAERSTTRRAPGLALAAMPSAASLVLALVT